VILNTTERILELGPRCYLEGWLIRFEIIEKTCWSSLEPNGTGQEEEGEREREREKGVKERRKSDRNKK
jgi:hypothetical protein